MQDQEGTLESIGRVAMKWLEDSAGNPKNGSYMEAVADLTGQVVRGALEAAGHGPREAPGDLAPGSPGASR